MEELPVLLDMLSRGSIAVVLGVMIWLGYTRRVVTRGELEECLKERDRLIAQQAEARERAERRLREANEDRLRIIADRDRLRKIVEDRRKKLT